MNTIPITQRVIDLTYSRKKVFHFSLTTAPICTNSFFSGGSKSEFKVGNMNTAVITFPNPGQYPWTTPNYYTLQPGDIFIETGVFCGKPMAPHIRCLPEDNEKVRAYLGIQ